VGVQSLAAAPEWELDAGIGSGAESIEGNG
jgi:hypothetical protein